MKCMCKAALRFCDPQATDLCPASTKRLLLDTNEAIRELHAFHSREHERVKDLAASLVSYVSRDDIGLDRKVFLRLVAERIIDDLDAHPTDWMQE